MVALWKRIIFIHVPQDYQSSVKVYAISDTGENNGISEKGWENILLYEYIM